MSGQEKIIRDYFSKVKNISIVYLFGSVAGANERTDSDIDIAVLSDRGKLSFEEKIKMITDLIQRTNREIDLIDLNDVSCILQMQVLKKGKLLICRDEKKRIQFQTRVVQSYLDLKKIRKPIEEQLKNVSLYG